ncbi:MAG: protein phosphatase 2C domain-containing protein [Gammaproteobacteria bacterium]|nr:protein phosphatase 2C domain-containing protein [Gammaproteobacteria bacterium]
MAFRNCGHLTHVGNVRQHNEDAYCIDTEYNFGVLADGMGGHEGGEIASRIVVECVCAEIRAGRPMADALVQAHHAVRKAADRGEGKPGMGSTALALKMDQENFEIVWVGDSRAYLWDGTALTQITKDHSLVQALVDDGSITLAEARVHPQRNYITQAIGMSDLQTMQVGRVQGRLCQGQQLLLCSDGLTGEVSDAEIAEILGLELNEKQKTDLLIQKSLDNGGADNITVLLVAGPAEDTVSTAD